jgi:hypothetical protein
LRYLINAQPCHLERFSAPFGQLGFSGVEHHSFDDLVPDTVEFSQGRYVLFAFGIGYLGIEPTGVGAIGHDIGNLLREGLLAMRTLEPSTVEDQEHFLPSQRRIMDPSLLGIVVNPTAQLVALRTERNVPAGSAVEFVPIILSIVALTHDVQLLQSEEFRHYLIVLSI